VTASSKVKRKTRSPMS